MSTERISQVTWKRMLAALLLLLVVGVLAVGISNSGQPNTADINGAGARSAGSSNAPGAGLPPSDAAYRSQGPDIDLGGGGIARQAAKHDVSPPLRDIPIKKPGPIEQRELQREAMPEYRTQNLTQDLALQSVFGPLAMPTPIVNFEGIYNYWGVIPPDTVGDVGPNHYVQMVNVGFQVFSKSGASLYGPANFNTLFTGFGGLCETRNDGDPIVVYDQIADRWVLTQFTAPPGPYFECIAVSTSGDPTGSYNRYAFAVSPVNFEDYPHFGVWPNGYYMSSNEFANGTAFAGAGFFAFDRQKMVAGDPTAMMIYFNRPPPNGGFLPSDLDGYTLPPAANYPNFFIEPARTLGNQLHEYKFTVAAWTPPAATLTGPFVIPVTAWDEDLCAAAREQCIPQPLPGTTLEALDDRLMHRLAYRNFGTHESLVVNHTVDTNSPAGRAGIRWYELRDPNNAVAPTLFQQGTFGPNDGLHRWMGSITMDSQGNMALGYSVSSLTQFPSIRYTGRLATDPPGQMSQGETSIVEGGGSQTETIAGRWGDYSSMNIDSDDCTFWYTQEYYSITGLRNWRTRIGSFKFPNCTPVVVTPTPTSSPVTPIPTQTASATVTATPTSCATGQMFTGSIGLTDPTQNGRLARNGIASSCAVPKTCPGAGDTVTRHYDAYTFTNNSGSSQCITVRVVNNCENNALLSAAYLGSFDPNNVCTNYLADMGASGPQFSYSFNVAPGATYVITVLENSANVGCTAYTLSVDPCPVGTPVPTVTGTPPTATMTSTPLPTNTPLVPTATGTPPTNTPTASPTPLGCGATQPLVEGFEGATQTFTSTTTLGSEPWTVVTGTVNSGLRSAHVPDPVTGPADQQLTQVSPLMIPANAISATMSFAHTYSFENDTEEWDGGVLEYSTNGTTWTDAGSFIIQGGYTGVITVTGGSPLLGRPAWVGRSPGYPAFRGATVDLMPLRGSSVQFRFRMGADANTGAPGWWVDDIAFLFVQPCPTGTVTVTPTNTSVAATATTTATVGVPTSTGTTGPPTATSTNTATSTATRTATATATWTNSPTNTPSTTFAPTSTTTSTSTGTVTPVPTSTHTHTPGPSSTPTNTAVVPTVTNTATPIPTGTSTSTSTTVPPSATRTSTTTPTQTAIVPTATTQPTSTSTSTATRTSTATTVASATNTPLIPTSTFTTVPPSATSTSTIAPTQTPGGPTATLVPTSTSTAVAPTATRTNTPVPPTATRTTAPTQTPGGPTATTEPSQTPVPPTSTVAPSSTPTVCTISFPDVPPDNIFYTYIRCLACRGIISGYSDGTFRPFNDITRAQIAKMVSNAAGFSEDPGPQLYEDVPPESPFYQWINRLTNRGHMGGYPCGLLPEEPCIEPDNRPYFRPSNSATRAQLAKIVSNAAGLIGTPAGQFYTDVEEGHSFYLWIMRLTDIGVMSGYECGGEGEPCDPENRPYFRPYNNVTRGQASKIVANTFFPNCQTPSRR